MSADFVAPYAMGEKTHIAFLMPLLIGVWMPDFLFFGSERTLAEAVSSSGEKFEVRQRLGGDFYKTELVVTNSREEVNRIVIEPDGSKTWNAGIILDERARVASVSLGKNFVVDIPWSN